jgi:acyl dehydratase
MLPMPLNYHVVKNWSIPDKQQTYELRDTIIYNLGIGAGLIDHPEEAQLDFVWERRLKPIPTIATVLASGDPKWMYHSNSTITWAKMLHAEEATQWHAPMEAEGTVLARSVVEEIYDRGAQKGALLVLRRELYDGRDHRHLATLRSSILLLADGGFGGMATPLKPIWAVPTATVPDFSLDLRTRPEQALIYRLSGDYYPLHVDPQFARTAGFERPILHGLATYGIAARAMLRLLCNDEPARLRRLAARFVSPVYPGETLTTDVWTAASGAAAFRCRVGSRIVVTNGFAAIGGER